MSWLYSQALVAAYLEATCLDGEQSAPLSGKPTPQAYCAPDKMTGFSRLSQFGMTYEPLTQDLGQALLTWYLEGFRVRTSQPQAREMDSMENEAPCGLKWRGWLARLDPDSSLWRTAQCSLLEEESESLQTLPRWGMTVDGLLWEQPTLEPITNGTGCGLSEKLPTPQATDYRDKPTSNSWKTKGGINFSLGNPELRAMWPTPTTKGYGHAAEGMVGNLIEKIEQGMITKQEAENMLSLPKLENHRTWKKKYPTPQASDHRDRGNMSNPSIQRRAENGKQLNLSMVAHPTSGQLNPTWVEWLMGWPLGWTDLKPLAMDKFPCVQQQPGDGLTKTGVDDEDLPRGTSE